MMTSSSASLFEEFAQEVRPRIEAALDRYSQYGQGCPPHLAKAIRHSLLAPGKRLRPLLVLMAAHACGCEQGAGLPAACAVEMVHTYSLIHDDLPAMDDDDLRRGRPSCHAAFGEATAILAGDALLAQAFEIMANGIHPPEVAANCCGVLAQAAGAAALVGGQADDLAADANSWSIEQLETIHHRKTGALFRASLRLGGLVAAASPSQLAALEQYAANIGLAFQIVDDLLDLRTETGTLGKTMGKDAKQNKLTFPALLGEEASRRRAEKLIGQARESIADCGVHGELLSALACYILERSH